MTGAASTVAAPEWFLARDGEQFGPLSDAELRKLVEFGHLKPTDLLWREGFPEWRSARILLNDAPPAAPAAAKPAPPAAQAPAPTTPAPVTPSHPAQHGPTGHATATAAFAQPQPQPRPAPQPAPYGQTPGAIHPAAAYNHSAPQSARPPGPSHAGPATPGPSTPVAMPSRPVDFGPPAAAAPVATQQRRPAAAPVHRADDDGEDDDIEESSPAVRWLKRLGVLLFFSITLAAAGWYAYPYRDRILSTLKMSSLALPGMASVQHPLAGFKPTAESTDAALQGNELWRILKREFPEWYGERTKEAAALAAAGKPEADIGRQMMQGIIALRRKHAGDALSATLPRLRSLASAFGDNLVELRKVSVDACHMFVSSGEASPEYLRLLADGNHSRILQSQLIALFEAVADGRKVPRIYTPPKQADYNLLVAALEGRGWTDADMALFSDSRRFGAASPDKVCKMVTDWFKAQVDLKDPDAQLRLLADALKPVVAG